LVVVITLFPPARIFLLVPIGYYIGKRMMSSLEGYSTRRYQYLAVTLTYLCFLIGFTIPAVREQRDAITRNAENRAKMQGTMATQNDALREELAALNASQGDPADPISDEDSPSEELAAAAPPTQVAADDIGPGPGLAFVLLLFSPFFAMMQFGMMASAMGVLALGYALYQAWKQTDGQGMSLDLRGPFRVGQGPIPAH
jgi:Na+-transporting NADH:ubiquinone oxidoreductase subunit NqrD